MIGARMKPAAAPFTAALSAKARAIVEAEAESRIRAARRDPWRWRATRLLWPLFGDR